MHVRFPVFLAALLLAPALAAAQPMETIADTTVVLPGVTVTATRSATATITAPVRVDVLDAATVASTGAQSVADLLDARAGAFVKRYGGGLATLSLRGTTASQTLVLLDGQRIADPQLGQLDLSLLPSVLLSGAEVMHGPGSALYGTDGIGGVVNLRTVQPDDAPLARVQTNYGAFGERSLAGLASAGTDRVAATVAAEYAHTEGDFPFEHPFLFPPQDVRRENADRQRTNLFARLATQGDAHRMQGAVWYSDAERGLPGPLSVHTQNERQWDRSLRLWGGHDRRFGWGTVRAGGLVQRSSLRYANPQLGVDDTGRTLTASFEAEAQTHRVARWLLAGGLAGGYARAAHPSLADAAHTLHGSLFTYATGQAGRLLVYPALRLDAHAPNDGLTRVALSPRLGANMRLLERAPVYLKASAGRAFRMPTFNDRFWQPGGDPDLRPEHGWMLDVGLATRLGGIAAEVTAYRSLVTNQIVWHPSPNGSYAPANLRRARTLGLEASLRIRQRPASWLAIHAGGLYAYTDARDRSGTSEDHAYDHLLRYVPAHQLKTDAEVHLGPLALSIRPRYTGCLLLVADGDPNDCADAAASERGSTGRAIAGGWLVDAGARLRLNAPGTTATLALTAVNLGDARREVVKNYPLPPRHVRLQLTLEAGED